MITEADTMQENLVNLYKDLMAKKRDRTETPSTVSAAGSKLSEADQNMLVPADVSGAEIKNYGE